MARVDMKWGGVYGSGSKEGCEWVVWKGSSCGMTTVHSVFLDGISLLSLLYTIHSMLLLFFYFRVLVFGLIFIVPPYIGNKLFTFTYIYTKRRNFQHHHWNRPHIFVFV